MVSIRFGFPMCFLWTSYGLPMGFLWAPHGLPTGFLCASYGLSMGFLWASHSRAHMVFIYFCVETFHGTALEGLGPFRGCFEASKIFYGFHPFLLWNVPRNCSRWTCALSRLFLGARRRYRTLFNLIQSYSTIFNSIQPYSTLFNPI